MEEVVEVMRRRSLDILGISETRWKGRGEREVGFGYRIWWSGGENGRRNGVAIMMSKKMASRVMKVEPVNDRIIKITIRMEREMMDIIQAYAPQTGCTDEEKVEFEEELERQLREEKTVIMGDMNARVGKDRQGYEEIMGCYGIGERNQEGEKLLDVCLRNGVVVGNTWHVKRESQKFTRYNWNGEQPSLIDYVLVKKCLQPFLIDVKVIPSENLGGDHRLLIADFKWLRFGRVTRLTRIKTWKLRDRNVKEDFVNKLKERVPRDEIKTGEEEWTRFKKAIVETAEETCGRTSGRKRDKETPWWNERIAEAIKNKNRAWRDWFKDRTDEKRERWKRIAKEAKKMLKEAKGKSWKEFEDKMKSNFEGNKKIFYGLIKNKTKPKEMMAKVLDVHGEIKWKENEVLETWKEYFKELLEGTEEEEDGLGEEINNEDDDDLSVGELEKAVKEMKDGKSPGEDEVQR